MLDDGDDPSELVGDPLLSSGLDEVLHRLERSNLGPPALGVLEDAAQDIKYQPASLDRRCLNQRGHCAVHGAPDRLALVLREVEDGRDEGQEDALDTGAEAA